MATEQSPYLVDEKDLPKNLVPVPVEPSGAPAPPVPHDMPQFFSGSMPPQVQHDTQFVGTKLGTPRIPSYDLMPLGIQGNPSTNAAIQSTATKIVQAAIAAIPPADAGDVESIFTNVQSVTQYVVQVSDRVKLVSMNNNAGGTVVLPAGTVTKGTFEHAVTNNGNSATASASGTPYTGGGIALLYAAADNAGTLQSPITFTPGTWTKLYGAGGGDEQLYTTVMPSSATGISPSATVSPSAGWVTTLAFFQNTTAVSLVQRASGGGGGLGNGTFPIVFGSNITKGNSIIVFITAASYTFGASGYPTPAVPTDTQGNTYKLIGHVIEDLGTAPGNFSPQTWIWIAENAVGGANTTNVVLSGGSAGGSISATIYGYELALTGASTSTGFDNGWYCYIENTGSGTFNVVSAAQIDGASGATIALGHNAGIIAAFDGTNWFTERGAGSGGTSPQNTPAITHEVITAYNSTTGVFTQAQLTQGDILAGAIANGSTATTQAAGDNTTDVATDQFVTSAIQGVISGTTPADGMRHGDSVWWADSAYVAMRDDFLFKPGVTAYPDGAQTFLFGELNWVNQGTAATGNPAIEVRGGGPPHMGILAWGRTNTRLQAETFGFSQNNATTTLQRNAYALLENPGWKCSYVFQFQGSMSTTALARFQKQALYIGFQGVGTFDVWGATNINSRPATFLGLRYDTSGVPNGMSVTSVAAASGGSTVYTGSFASSLANAWKGTNITIRGCENAANNGTFACTASTTTTLTLTSAAGVVETVANGTGAALPASINITQVAAHSGANTAYTIADPLALAQANNGAYIGMSFVVTGCTNSANNGTFTCVGSSSTSLVLNNGAGVLETPTANTAFAAGTKIADTVFVFESRTADLQFAGTGGKKFNQGTTSSTGITPQIGNWYRLDISCTTAGSVVMTLIDENNATSASHTFTVAQQVITTSSVTWATNGDGILLISPTVNSTVTAGIPGTVGYLQVSTGSTITISGLSAPLTGLNAAWSVATLSDNGINSYTLTINTGIANLSSAQVGTITYYPALSPYFAWGNDDSTNAGALGSLSLFVDFFSLAWNKGIASTSNTPNSAKSRYW